ncbi:Crp/Fnr family transcriptional regulator [Chryseosolibacter indicus]|uniref:Crp/Fnr family transcriptional regulator n=1 Tax=Chryseosolibacter indicus TaxID=2782351 RepID=A0ABS5VVU3_9BACT|nr:Crp/Fnr family transcriptional regulator [Chryseosolibacter indicus]MBT1704932.1 Crp/Fnr family transcriptional regulator [Chryseosolibacter indicus]
MSNTEVVDVFLHYLSSKISLSDAELDQIRTVSIVKKLRKKQYLLQEGDVWRYHAFVADGFLRTFSVDEKSNEHIMNFSPENYWTGDRASLSSGNPSRFYIEALEDSAVVLITDQNFQGLCKRIPQLNELVNAILHRSFIVSQDRIHSSIALSAEEKYHHFLEKYPGISNRVPQHMIASFIGVTPETLTRIRRNSTKK